MSSRHRLALIAATLLVAGCSRESHAPPPEATTAGDIVFTNAAIELPSDDSDFPAAPGVEAVRNNCTACHSSAMILSQPPLKREQWQAEIEKMQKAYHAPVDPAAVPAIIDYLAGLPR